MAETVNPAGEGGALNCQRGSDRSEHSRKHRKPATTVRVHGEDGDRIVTLRGRVAWTLGRLVAAGERGITPLDCPTGVRLAHYVFRLRSEGIAVETEREMHDGPFFGRHARYRLACRVSAEPEGGT